MDGILLKIKALVRANAIRLTFKADMESEEDGISIEDIKHIILTADHITDIVQSAHPKHLHDDLYIIIGYSVNGDLIYTKGKMRSGLFYILVSAHLT